MIALCARRFSSIWKTNAEDFAKKVFAAYHKDVKNLEALFHARMLERAVSDMIWEPWAALKGGLAATFENPEENKYVIEANGYLNFLGG